MKRLLTLSLLAVLVTATVGTSQEIGIQTVYTCEITSATQQTGPSQVTVVAIVDFCFSCNPSGRSVTATVKEGTTIIGTATDDCSSWPLEDTSPHSIVVNTSTPLPGTPVTIELSAYCDWCGGWGATPLTIQTAIPITIDIKPGSCPNAINLNNKGVIAVAILSTASFDAADVDVSTVLFAGAAPVRSAVEDVDSDGDLDLILQFKTADVGINPGDTEATLTGQTTGGANIAGTDAIVTVPAS